MSKILDYNTTCKDRSSRDNYKTPKKIYDLFMSFGYFDPCPYNENYIINGLTIAWKEKCFVNPPFSNIKGFVNKAIDELLYGETYCVWFLVPLNCDTKWFKSLFNYIKCIVFVNGRIKFNDLKNGIPISMALIKLSSIINKDNNFNDIICNCLCIHESQLADELKSLLSMEY